jgi:16S rRNA (adenine1518-N6/adenine1519-N6)-dimethyltransferase
LKNSNKTNNTKNDFVRPKKHLGQHFLKDKPTCQKIADQLTNHRGCMNVLEIGPGMGALSEYLIAKEGLNLKFLDVDQESIDYLKVKYPEHADNILYGDFLRIKMEPIMGIEPFCVVGNFPYNISTQILFKVLDWKEKVPVVIGMFQKEVAQRAASKEGSKVYGVLSVLIQAFYEVEYLFDVSNQSFNPPPKVESGVIRLKRKTTTLSVKSDRAFQVLVKTAFNQRRKTLRNAVKSLFSPEVLADEIFNRRAETLSVEEFAAMTFRMN